MQRLFHSFANYAAALSMKLLFGYVARVRVLRRENANHKGAFLLASNHISHFDPFILSSVVRRKIDWMAMAEFFPNPLFGSFLRAVDAFPADRHRADRKTIRTAIERLKQGRIVGVWPLRRTPIWIAFGDPISSFPELEKSCARQRIERELAAVFKSLYAELREEFSLTADDLPHPPRERMKNSARAVNHEDRGEHEENIRRIDSNSLRDPRGKTKRNVLPHFAAKAVDSLMCASMNLLQSRHRLHARSRNEMERYVAECEKLTAHDYYAVRHDVDLASAIGNGASATWRSPIETKFPANNIARADFFLCRRGWRAPIVLMLHALMSASHTGYRRWAARLNELGWNACFVHLPYHYSRVPRGYWNGELAITADLIRNAEGLRQGVIEVRQLIAALRKRGCSEFGVLGTSYGGWIGALLAMVERDFRFVALMAPIVNVEHAIWESPATAFMRRELRREKIEPSLVARHFHLSSPVHNEPLCDAERVLFVAGEFDSIARPADIEKIHEKWRGSELLRVPQGHFGYRMLRETIACLKERAL